MRTGDGDCTFDLSVFLSEAETVSAENLNSTTVGN